MPGTVIGITADDLTGACDTAAAFARPGASVAVSLDPDPPRAKDERRAFAVTTDSRGLPPEEVFDLVADSASNLRMAGASLIYKKLDSNLRGNVGTELAALLDTIGGPVLLAPAFPARGRTTVGATVLINSIPVTETEMAHDPESPLRHAHLPDLLAEQHPGLRVGHCPLAVVRQGPEAIAACLRPGAVLVADAETDADLDLLTQVALAAPPGRAVAGSAGLAAALSRALLGERQQRQWPTPRVSPVLAVLASSSRMLAAQVTRAAATVRLTIVPFPCEKLTWNEQPVQLLNSTTGAVAKALSEGRDVLVHATGALPQGERPVALVVEHLANLTLAAVRRTPPRALLVGGGATAQAVLGMLGARALEIDDEPLPGIAAGTVAGGEFDGRPVVLKPGAAGSEMAVAELLRYLGRRAASEGV